jgi:hypothetical protein
MSITSFIVPVPTSGEGAIVDVSTLVGAKTVVLTGRFEGIYELLASQNDSQFVPVLQFDAGGIEGVQQTVTGAFKSVRLRSKATPFGPVTCKISGVVAAGQNYFTTLANLAAGFAGVTPVIDLAPLFPPTGPEEDIAFLCRGNFANLLIVEGSLDGSRFCPIGSWRVDGRPEGSSDVLEFTVLSTSDKTRYIRLTARGGVGPGGVVVTLGGRISTGGTSGSQTLFQTYNIGTTAADQTMVVDDTAHGGGILIDASTAAVTGAATSSLEVRQNALHDVPVALTRYINQVPGPELKLYHSRGTFAAQLDVQPNDELGTVNFYGRVGGVPVLGNKIVAVQQDIAPNATGFHFYVTARSASAPSLAMQLDEDGPGANTVLLLYNNPQILPSVDHQGAIGSNSERWSEISVDNVKVFANVRMGGGSVGGGANLTVMLSNASTMPAVQANQVYLGAKDWTGSSGSNLAALAITSEEPAVGDAEASGNTYIPIMFNGVPYYLVARSEIPS